MSVLGRGFPISFLVTTEVPCPYLADRMERKVITELSGGNAPELFELLSHAGFRRSHSIAYRPACSGCQACVPVRIPVAEFDRQPHAAPHRPTQPRSDRAHPR